MSVLQHPVTSETDRSASLRPTRNNSGENTAIDPSRGSLPSRGRRSEEGILFDPRPAIEVSQRTSPATQVENKGTRVAVAPRTSIRPTVEVQGFSRDEMGRIKQASNALEVLYAAQTSLRSGLSRLYAELATFNPFPAPELFSRMGQWIGSGFGLMQSAAAEESEQLESIQERISSKIHQVKQIHTQKIAGAEAQMRDEFRGRTFLADRETPRLLKQVSIPVGNTHVPYENLQQTLKAELGVGGNRIKVSCPSEERTIIYRKRSDNSWESLELSWRQPGKVDIIRNGIKEAHLFNEDALKAARFFAEGRRVSFKEKKVDPNTVWKVI